MNAPPYWSIPPQELFAQLQTSARGLGEVEAHRRRARYASARLKPHQDIRPLLVLLAQFRNPIVLILLFAAAVSFFLACHTDALIILTIIVVSALLGFWQEHGAAKAVASLLALVRVKAEVWRDGHHVGDVVRFTFSDDSVLTVAGEGWDLGYPSCFCWQGALSLPEVPFVLPQWDPWGSSWITSFSAFC